MYYTCTLYIHLHVHLRACMHNTCVDDADVNLRATHTTYGSTNMSEEGMYMYILALHRILSDTYMYTCIHVLHVLYTLYVMCMYIHVLHGIRMLCRV